MFATELVTRTTLPDEHITTKHYKRCTAKDKPAKICCDYPEVTRNTYKVFYMCRTCWKVQEVVFRKEETNNA